MSTTARTVRIGEWVGPVDPDYDFAQHSWDHGGTMNPIAIDSGRDIILQMAENPDGWTYCPTGFATFLVVHVGMYDGWPFWVPTPSLGYIGPIGVVEVEFFYSLRGHSVNRVGIQTEQTDG